MSPIAQTNNKQILHQSLNRLYKIFVFRSSPSLTRSRLKSDLSGLGEVKTKFSNLMVSWVNSSSLFRIFDLKRQKGYNMLMRSRTSPRFRFSLETISILVPMLRVGMHIGTLCVQLLGAQSAHTLFPRGASERGESSYQ